MQRPTPKPQAPLLAIAGHSAPVGLTAEVVVASDVEALVALLAERPVDAVLADPDFCPADALTELIARPAWMPSLLQIRTALDPTRLDMWVLRAHRQRIASQNAETADSKHQVLDRWANDLRRELSEALHDLKTPVAVIEGYCANLIDGLDGVMSESQTNSVERIRFSAKMMTEVMERTETIADRPTFQAPQRLATAAGTSTKREQLDLHAVADRVMTLFEREANARSIQLAIDAPDDLPAVWGDASRLNQLIVNLIGNALRFVSADGFVRIQIRAQDAERPDGTVRLSVTDSGPGIDPSIAETLFDAGVTHSGRAGLGLAIAQQIAHEHGAQLSVDAGGAHGRGATFHVVLPVDPRSRRASSLEVLLIDDPALAGQLLIELRNRYGNRLPVGRPRDMEVLASTIVQTSSTIVFAGEVEQRLQERTMDLDLIRTEEL